MKIGTREVGRGRPTFVIAECGSNHGGSLDAALALIDAAAEAGADAAKFQYFRVDRFLVARPDPEALRPYELPNEWLPQLYARCVERGIEFLCTAFDPDSLDVIDPFVNAHKIGSWEATHFLYCLAVHEKEKPVLASLGMMPGRHVAPDGTPQDTIPLVCRSAYPSSVDGYLADVSTMFSWGVSDHTLDPITVPSAAVALGACVVEKHMRLYLPGERYGMRGVIGGEMYPDFTVSIPYIDFGGMVRAIRATESAVRG